MENCVDEPSSLGAAMPSVSKYAAVGPVPPLLPQLPHVSHGFSSTRFSTVLLGDVPGVGVGAGGAGVAAGDGAGVGAGKVLAVVVAVLPPQDTTPKIKARINEHS